MQRWSGYRWGRKTWAEGTARRAQTLRPTAVYDCLTTLKPLGTLAVALPIRKVSESPILAPFIARKFFAGRITSFRTGGLRQVLAYASRAICELCAVLALAQICSKPPVIWK